MTQSPQNHSHSGPGDGGEHLKPESVSTGDLVGDYPTKIRVIDSTGVVETIDPSVATPIQNALSSAGTEATILLPVGAVSDPGPLSWPNKVSIIGHGPYKSAIDITGTGDGIQIDTSSTIGCDFRGFALRGPGFDQATGNAVSITGSCYDIELTNLLISQWADTPFYKDSGAVVRNFDVSNVRFQQNDPGLSRDIIDLNGGGPNIRFEDINMSPTDASSGEPSQGFSATSQSGLTVNNLNIGGSAATAGAFQGDVYINGVNYEPDSRSTDISYVMQLLGGSAATARNIRFTAGTKDHIIRLSGSPKAKDIGVVEVTGSATLNQAKITVAQDIGGAVFCKETAAEVSNDTGSLLSNPVWCEGDGVYKQSNGAGYDGGSNDRKV